MPETSSAPVLRDDQVPRGFSFAAVRAGLKASGKPDLACALTEQPAVAAAMFTSNKVIAAPLIVPPEIAEPVTDPPLNVEFSMKRLVIFVAANVRPESDRIVR